MTELNPYQTLLKLNSSRLSSRANNWSNRRRRGTNQEANFERIRPCSLLWYLFVLYSHKNPQITWNVYTNVYPITSNMFYSSIHKIVHNFLPLQSTVFKWNDCSFSECKIVFGTNKYFPLPVSTEWCLNKTSVFNLND